MAASPLEFPSALLHLDSQTNDGRSTVKCTGKITSDTAPQLKAEVKRLMAESQSLVLDLSGVSFMDSSGLGTLVGLFLSARHAHCQLRLINLGDRIKDLLRLTRLADVFEGYGEYL